MILSTVRYVFINHSILILSKNFKMYKTIFYLRLYINYVIQKNIMIIHMQYMNACILFFFFYLFRFLLLSINNCNLFTKRNLMYLVSNNTMNIELLFLETSGRKTFLLFYYYLLLFYIIYSFGVFF